MFVVGLFKSKVTTVYNLNGQPDVTTITSGSYKFPTFNTGKSYWCPYRGSIPILSVLSKCISGVFILVTGQGIYLHTRLDGLNVKEKDVPRKKVGNKE